jgi:hypothetical protein
VPLVMIDQATGESKAVVFVTRDLDLGVGESLVKLTNYFAH